MNYVEPYKSCSLFGALRYFINIKNSIFLIHGPSGCAFFNRSSALQLNGFYEPLYPVESPKVYCTDFNEDDAIFGGSEKVKEAAKEIISDNNLDVLFVFNCCVSEVIGEDIERACREIEIEYKVKCIAIHSGGFKGDHKYGMRMAAETTVDRLMPKEVSFAGDSINIIGDFDFFGRGSSGVYKDLCAFGFSNMIVFPGNCAAADISAMANSKLNIIFCQNASRHMAELMKKKFGIPYVGAGGDYFGTEKCLELYKTVCTLLGIDDSAVYQRYCQAQSVVNLLKKELEGTTAVIVAGMHRASGYAEMLNELGVIIKYIYSECEEHYFDNSFFAQYTDSYICNDRPGALRSVIREIQPDFLFSTLPDLISPIEYLHQGMIDFSGFEGIVKFGEYLVDAKHLGYECAYKKLKERENEKNSYIW